MILFRMDELEGKFCDIAGGQDQYSYDGDNTGWMPIENMNFGFNSSDKSKAAKGGKTGTAPAPSQATSGAGASATAGAAGQEADKDFQGIQVTRFVDMASTQLMKLAMKDRKEDDKSGNRKADFHFLHSVMGKGTSRSIFPYMMVTLENVIIKNWNINATGDDRPQETVEIWFEKAAMRYYRTKDGKVWIGGQAAGWDQHKHEEWAESDISNKFFKEPKKS